VHGSWIGLEPEPHPYGYILLREDGKGLELRAEAFRDDPTLVEQVRYVKHTDVCQAGHDAHVLEGVHKMIAGLGGP
jgi:hypothetical protein